MKRSAISSQLRKRVAERAGFRCEYCKFHENDMFLNFEIDHIIAIKHDGTNEFSNFENTFNKSKTILVRPNE